MFAEGNLMHNAVTIAGGASICLDQGNGKEFAFHSSKKLTSETCTKNCSRSASASVTLLV